jgi:hypothetical protein
MFVSLKAQIEGLQIFYTPKAKEQGRKHKQEEEDKLSFVSKNLKKKL